MKDLGLTERERSVWRARGDRQAAYRERADQQPVINGQRAGSFELWIGLGWAGSVISVRVWGSRV